MKKYNILICDDEESVRESLSLILSDQYNLVFAKDAKEASSMLSKDIDVDLLLIDIKMPDKNGFDLLKELKSTGTDIPFIIITGYQSVEAASEATKLGALDYVVKPFEPELVSNAVKKALH